MISTYDKMMKTPVASLPPALPLLEVYTSSLVSPVARIEVTRIITDTAPITAPVIVNANWTGSNLQQLL